MRPAVISLLLLITALPAQAADITGQASVIDGDTLEIHGERIRLSARVTHAPPFR